MSQVIVTSKNPAKIAAVEAAFRDVFPEQPFTFTGVAVPSDVPDQPMTEKETYAGACNRVQHAKAKYEGDFYVGVEAGLDHQHTFAWMVIDDGTTRGEARSASLPLPPEALRALHHGEELGDVMDRMFSEQNVKQKGGAIGMLTGHRLTRSSVYHQALILALIPFLHPHLYR
ncbi:MULTISPECIES: inosine/xanthosine triphosphatase [Salinivibrio]|uniref:Inosine/xanthosine triphosphatase n=2 Tax=Salinivibrio TaxID=51366 RepID=A0ABY7LB59_9GAMM|nr:MULTISPECIES: inosine/xanthosine triphosphatase [Salinivibrio]OOF22251.1 inosine/xanthosine triphosphatase [Salinivibrio sp. IB574]OOF26702.1 inosine/xanthosine triphosphatase [Salinivibrio sp. IB872]QIR06842.1 non-canonical purine NTP phosphatase [Salinivibrio costicola]WBA14323.1 inosine/xanthosine triphosphatase [Salinivibrio proteolyticus]